MASDNHIDNEAPRPDTVMAIRKRVTEAAARQHASESADAGIVSIRSADYDETEAALAADPIIQAMAAEIPEHFDTQGWSFTTAALHEYKARGGTIGSHIGGPAAAIRLVLAAEADPHGSGLIRPSEHP